MPLYEYKCSLCNKKFEVLQKFSDEPLTTHPGCGGPVEKLFSAPAFHLKGTGWYATDYAKTNGISAPKTEDSKSADAAKGESSSASESKASGKSSENKGADSKAAESKPAATEAKPASTASDSKT